MRTSKPIATISYNSPDYLMERLGELVRNHKISDWMFIHHYPEKDEGKEHFHVYIEPNTLLDTMELQDFFKEIDLTHPTKPLKCINFVSSKIDDWILYGQHYAPYLASKGESREYHYAKTDFWYLDEDTFENNYNHAFKGSEWARRHQILEALNSGTITPTELIRNGTVPLNMASQLNAYKYMEKTYGLDRGSHYGHDYLEDFQ